MNKFLLWCLLLLSGFSQAQSHAYFLSEFTRNSSVLGNIRSMAYDQSGFLWVAGQASEVTWGMFMDRGAVLQRSDGEHFHDIPIPDFDFPIEHISQITVSDDGKFYLRCVSKYGIMFLILDTETIKFEKVIFPETDQLKELQLSNIFPFEGHYYVLGRNKSQVVLYELIGSKAEKVTVLERSKNLQINLAADFIPYRSGFLVGYISQGIYYYDWNGKLKKNLGQLISKKNVRSSAWITGKWHYKNDVLFTFDNTPILYRFSEKTEKIEKKFDFTERIQSRTYWFWNDGTGRLLLAVNDGADLEIFEVSANGLTLINNLDGQNISDKSIIYSKDVTQNLWIGNPGSHLNYYWFFPGEVQRFLLSKSVRSLYPLGKNKILASTEFSGWFEINLKENSVKDFETYFKNNPEPLKYTRNIIAAKDSTWVWTNYRYGIVKLNLNTHAYESWEGLAIESLGQWNDSTLIYGTMNLGLWAFDIHKKKHKKLLKNDSLWILGLASSDERIFAATDNGLLVYDGTTKKSQVYKTGDKIDDSYFLTILKKDDHAFLLGTKSGKVYEFNPQTKDFKLFYEDELKAPVANLIYYENKLCINTFIGVISLDLETGETERYSTLNGLSNNETNRYSALATENGLLIGTVSGLNYFEPDEIKNFESDCNIVPLSLTFYDENRKKLITIRNKEKLKSGSEFELPANNRFFQLNFGMGTCFSPLTANFKYRMDDNPWVQLSQGRRIRFESLNPGTYHLEIAAFDFSGRKIAESLNFQIVSQEYFIETWWFKLLVFLFLLALISAYYFNNLRKIKEEQALRTSISSDLHDEVGGLLTGISMRAEILGTTDLAEDMQKDFAQSIAASSKEAVRAMRDVVWAIDARKDDWESLLFRLREFGNMLFEDSQTDFSLEKEGIAPRSIPQRYRQEIYLICKEALNNCAKHSAATKVWMKCDFSHHRIQIIIEDNGVGIKTENVSGQGLKNMRMRAAKIKSTIEINYSEKGTQIILLIK